MNILVAIKRENSATTNHRAAIGGCDVFRPYCCRNWLLWRRRGVVVVGVWCFCRNTSLVWLRYYNTLSSKLCCLFFLNTT